MDRFVTTFDAEEMHEPAVCDYFFSCEIERTDGGQFDVLKQSMLVQDFCDVFLLSTNVEQIISKTGSLESLACAAIKASERP